MKMQMNFTVTIRKRSTGARVTYFVLDDLQYAHAIANTMMESPNWCICYCVCTDPAGQELFTLQHKGVQVQAAQPGYGGAPAQYPQIPQQSSQGYYPPEPPEYVQPPQVQQYNPPPPASGYAPASNVRQLPAPRREPQPHVVDASWQQVPPPPRKW